MLNLTPHAITIRTPDGDITFQPSGTVARVAVDETHALDVDGIPTITRTSGAVVGLPDDGTPCIVSGMVLDAVRGRAGVFAPDTGATAIRDEGGRIVAVTRLVRA
jgi:hypothetical protein